MSVRRIFPFAPCEVLLLAAAMWACGGDEGGDVQAPPPAVATVTVTAPASTLEVGQTLQLTATAKDAGGSVLDGRTFEWATGDASIASVSETGLVTGLAPGSVEIRATSEGVTGSMVVSVTAPPPPSGGSVGLEVVASGLGFPLYLTSPPGDSRLFIVEKGGTIRIVKDGSLLPAPFLDLAGKVSGKAEQGLLGLAFPPDYASSGRFYVHYTDLLGDTQISFFRVSSDPDRADPGSESSVLTNQKPGPAHNGGEILFGPDGFLYIALGDGASHDGEDQGRGQSLDDLFGAILRIDVASGSGYTVPPDNPFVGTAGARPEIWSYGLRNPWRFSLDRATGDLFVGDVGESRAEEIDRAAVGDGAGKGLNFGWAVMEGTHCVRAGCDPSGLTPPTLEYDHSNGCAVTGGYVYRGAAIPSLQGQYFYADFCQGWVRSFAASADTPQPVDWPTLRPGAGIPSFGEDASGELYILSTDGRVLKIVPR